jgi:hypothetical protein
MSAKLPDPYVRFYIDHGVEVATMSAADFRAAMLERDNEIQRLRTALARGRSLVTDMDELMPSQATEDEDGFISSYRIPVGPWHRLLGWARGAW